VVRLIKTCGSLDQGRRFDVKSRRAPVVAVDTPPRLTPRRRRGGC